MPHLQDLSKQYAGKVTFIALSDEAVGTVGSFLKKKSPFDGQTWGEAMSYTVATDSDGSVKKALHEAAGQRGIPSTFIISDNKVQWIGHPMTMDRPLAQIVAGTYSIEKEKKRAEQMNELRRLFPEAQSSGDWSKVLSKMEQILSDDPENVDLRRAQWQILTFEVGDEKKGFAAAEKLAEAGWDDSNVLNDLAWTLLDDERVKNRRLDFSLRVAKRAAELTKHEDAPILDTLARAYYEKGDLSEAIQWQKKAVEHAEGPMRDSLQEVLDQYESEKKSKKGGKSL